MWRRSRRPATRAISATRGAYDLADQQVREIESPGTLGLVTARGLRRERQPGGRGLPARRRRRRAAGRRRARHARGQRVRHELGSTTRANERIAQDAPGYREPGGGDQQRPRDPLGPAPRRPGPLDREPARFGDRYRRRLHRSVRLPPHRRAARTRRTARAGPVRAGLGDAVRDQRRGRPGRGRGRPRQRRRQRLLRHGRAAVDRPRRMVDLRRAGWRDPRADAGGPRPVR